MTSGVSARTAIIRVAISGMDSNAEAMSVRMFLILSPPYEPCPGVYPALCNAAGAGDTRLAATTTAAVSGKPHRYPAGQRHDLMKQPVRDWPRTRSAGIWP